MRFPLTIRVIARIVIALGIILCSLYLYHSVRAVQEARTESVPLQECPVCVVFYDRHDNEELNRYECGSTACIGSCRLDGWRVKQLLGEGHKSRWLTLFRGDDVGSEKVAVAACSGKAVAVLSQLEWAYRDAMLFGDKLVRATVNEGALSIVYCDLQGDVVSKRVLRLKHNPIRELEGRVDISESGEVTAALVTQKHTQSHVYVFSEDGELIKHIGPGRKPRFSLGAKQLAYQPAESEADSESRYSVSVLDFEEDSKRQVVVWKPTRLRDIHPVLGGMYALSIGEMQWSPDGRWLVCSLHQHKAYRLLVVAVSMDAPTPRRCYLPITVEWGKWMVASVQPD